MQSLLIVVLRCLRRSSYWRVERWVLAGGLLLTSAVASAETTESGPRQHPASHPLMPGVVGRGLANPDWPRTQHDPLASGFSPLVCDMHQAPVVWGEIEVGGGVNFLSVVDGPGGQSHLLVGDKHLKLLTAAGETLWTRAPAGHLLGAGDLRGDGGCYALFGAGPRVIFIDLADGREIWRHEFKPVYCSATGQVADILPDEPGLEAAVFLTHGEEGCVINFLPDAAPQIVWQRKVVDGEFNERYDHHNGTIAIDLSQPDEPVLWNIRRHRCRGFDARTGQRLSAITYDIGDGQKRNYGPVHLGRGKDGQPLACVFGERVQVHSHAIRIFRDRNNELAWHHYYGEVYKDAPGVTMTSHGLVDLDGDGGHEMVYSIRDPSADFSSFVRFRAADSGEIKIDLKDEWGIGTFQDIGPEQRSGILTLAAPKGRTPSRGKLQAYQFTDQGTVEPVGMLKSAGSWGPSTIAGEMGDELLLREKTADGRQSLSRFRIENGSLVRTASTAAESLLAEPILAILPGDGPLQEIFVNQTAGRLRALAWDGTERWSVPIATNVASAVSAADMDGDGAAELAAATPDRRLRVYSCRKAGPLQQRASFEHLIGWHRHHPVMCDLKGDGQLSILAVGSDGDGDLTIRAHRLDGRAIWESPLPIAIEDLRLVILNHGYFLGPQHAGVAVSLADSRLVQEGTYLLDGRTGEALWFKGKHRDGQIIMPYRPNGIPTAVDFDGDGVEEIGMDMLSYMAFLNGADGAFAYLRHTSNIRADGALYGGRLYNTYCPLWRRPDDPRPHWFVTAGFGPFGLMNPDPEEGVWSEDLDYDVPSNICLVDVDGDHELEAGYAAINDATFFCRNVWTGDVEWTLELPVPPNGTTIAADFDGDGRGEFFCGSYCIGVNDQGQGELRWQAPVSFYWPIVADLDGDGRGEIAGGTPGKIVVLKARATSKADDAVSHVR